MPARRPDRPDQHQNAERRQRHRRGWPRVRPWPPGSGRPARTGTDSGGINCSIAASSLSQLRWRKTPAPAVSVRAPAPAAGGRAPSAAFCDRCLGQRDRHVGLDRGLPGEVDPHACAHQGQVELDVLGQREPAPGEALEHRRGEAHAVALQARPTGRAPARRAAADSAARPAPRSASRPRPMRSALSTA